jgi:hypothetical protein
MFKSDSENAAALIGKTVKDAIGTTGTIVSAIVQPTKIKPDVAIKFRDKMCLLETRFTFEEWFRCLQ